MDKAAVVEKRREIVRPADLPKDPLSADARVKLMELFSQLTVRHDDLGQEIVLNMILANLMHHRLYDQAEHLITTCTLTQPYRSTNQAARFFYYVGLIRAIRLNYADAHSYLVQSLRKAPDRAAGFCIAVTKLSLVVQLLTGEIPPRSEFLQPTMKEALAPYLQLTTCVRFGNLGRFQSILTTFQRQFEHDRTYTLICRIRHNVIKTSLRRVCQAYSRISLSDVCLKLALENPEDAEYIAAKAVADGVISASIDHAKGHVISSESVDVYQTNEPIQALQRRITFCNAIHSDAKRAMRFSTAKDLLDEEDKETLRRADDEDREIKNALEDGDDLGGDDGEDGP